MEQINETTLKNANEQALYNVFMYLIHFCEVDKCKTVNDAISKLKEKYSTLSPRNKRRYSIMTNGIRNFPIIGQSEIHSTMLSPDGFTASTFIKPHGDISVVFKGTGNGEWTDNGEGLSGIPESNTYITYAKGGKELHRNTVANDYASIRQVRALNYFSKALSENTILKHSTVTVSGHSKGGNKAQFVAINSDIPNACYSFCGYGFSPEAIQYFQTVHAEKFKQRCRNIISFSAENDYVNVLGKRIIPENNVYFLKSYGGFHFMESLLSNNGLLNQQSNQGALSAYISSVSDEIMSLTPSFRKHTTIGIMNIFQKYLGNNSMQDNEINLPQTIAGIAMALGAMLKTTGNH